MKQSGVLETASPARVHKASLPISRNNGPGYERPERARTSHACEPCRERKTKCDGERPSCHRCLHTGTGCHYGYGKGWRKRKTAEDLNVTSKRLQIYETLLTNIFPKVDFEVRAMIEEARSQDVMAMHGSDGADNSVASPPQHSGSDLDRSTSSSNPRLPLTLPDPTALVSPQNRPPPPAIPFERVSDATSPHLAHHPKREMPFEDAGHNRLPSITPQGLLIENSARDASPGYPRATVPPASAASPARPDPFSPNSASSLHELSSRSGSSPDFDRPLRRADPWTSPPTTSDVGWTWLKEEPPRHGRHQVTAGLAAPVATH